MSSTSVYDAFKARLIDQLGAIYPIRDWEEVETKLQTEINPWIAIEDSGAEDQLTSIGTPQQNWSNDTGYIDFHIFVKSGGPLASARTIGEAIRETFRYYQFVGFPAGETLRVTHTSAPEPGIMNDGLWHSMMITVQYIHRYAVATAAE